LPPVGQKPQLVRDFFLKKLPSFLGQIGIGLSVAVLTPVVLLIIGLIEHSWARATWHAIVRAWHWLGRDISISHWFYLSLIGCLAFVALRLGRTVFDRLRPFAPDPTKISAAQRWREALARHGDAFLAHRAKHLSSGSVDQDWVAEYRELRRETVDAYEPIARDFRNWIRDIDPSYLREFPNEPVWVDVDSGPDETPDGLVEKLWLPGSLLEALNFWHGWSQFNTQELFGDRVDWVDSFIERLKNPIKPGLQLSWRYRLRRWFRRQWRKLKGDRRFRKKR